MKFFMTEAERKQIHTTCCFEFQQGCFHNVFWAEDSLCLNADIFDKLKLYEIFSKAVPQFNYYGKSEVSPENWRMLQRLAQKRGWFAEKELEPSTITKEEIAAFEQEHEVTLPSLYKTFLTARRLPPADYHICAIPGDCCDHDGRLWLEWYLCSSMEAEYEKESGIKPTIDHRLFTMQ